MNSRSREEVDLVVNALCTRQQFHSHGSVINSKTAMSLGLPVVSLGWEDDLWKRIWLLYNMYSHDANKNWHGKIFESRVLSKSIEGDDPRPRG